MAYLVELYQFSTSTNYDITARTKAVEIQKTLDSGITNFKLECRAITDAHLFDRITVSKDGTVLIKGIVVGQSERTGGLSTEKLTVFTCQDYGYFLPKRIVAKNYASKTASYIINDLFATYATEFTRTNIDTSTTVISEAKFTYTSLKDAIEYVMGMSPDWHYYIDSNLDVHFFYSHEAIGATLTAADIWISTLQLNYEGIEHYNRVWIVGRKQADASDIDSYFTANGSQRYFGPLPYEPSTLTIFFTPSGLPEYQCTIAEESQDDGSSYDLLYNTKRRVFYIPDYQSPAAGEYRANYKPVRQFIEYFENNPDIATYGLMEKAIKNTQVTDKLETRKYGKNVVRQDSKIKRIVSFSSNGSDVLGLELGEKVTLNISQDSWSISGYFLVTRIAYSIKDQLLAASVEVEEL